MRKRFFGDTMIAQEYTRDASNLLEMVKHQMSFAKLQQGSRQITLENGVILMASSRFGQDEIQIFAPPVISGSVELVSGASTSWWAAGGFCENAVGDDRPVIWDSSGKVTDLGLLPGYDFGRVNGIGARGTVAVGQMTDYAGILGTLAFRWSKDKGFEDIGYIQPAAGVPPNSVASGISADGQTIVGTGTHLSVRGFYWTRAAGVVQISDMSNLNGVSADGKVVAGQWGAGGYWQNIGGTQQTIPGTEKAFGLSTDGKAIVGYAIQPDASWAWFRWAADTGTVILPSGNGSAYGISGDGAVTVGFGSSGSNQIAQYWTKKDGVVLLSAGEVTDSANAVSQDGQVIVGTVGPSLHQMPVWWDRGAVAHAMQLLPGGSHGEAYCIDMGKDPISS